MVCPKKLFCWSQNPQSELDNFFFFSFLFFSFYLVFHVLKLFDNFYYNRFPSRKQAIPLLTADAIICNKAFMYASYNILSQRPKL